jgi:hypothetical protein
MSVPPSVLLVSQTTPQKATFAGNTLKFASFEIELK